MVDHNEYAHRVYMILQADGPQTIVWNPVGVGASAKSHADTAADNCLRGWRPVRLRYNINYMYIHALI